MNETEHISKNLTFDPKNGVLSFKGNRYILIRPETIVKFQKEVERVMGDKTSLAMSKGGYEGGSLSAMTYMKEFDLSKEGVVDYMCSMGSQLGWGAFSLAELSDAKLVVDVHNSPFAEKYGSSDGPVCHMIEGVIAGLGKIVLASNVKSCEVMCAAMGDDICRFLVEKI